jgi:hypothetical protein
MRGTRNEIEVEIYATNLGNKTNRVLYTIIRILQKHDKLYVYIQNFK